MIEVGAEDRDGERVFFVRDNGVGMSPGVAQSLLAEGGIGLAAALRIVRRHGGRIWAVPGTTHGTTVHFTLVPR